MGFDGVRHRQTLPFFLGVTYFDIIVVQACVYGVVNAIPKIQL